MCDDVIVCRCSDISLKEVKDLISKGYTSFEEIKRISRAGMGPCQGRTCTQIILREISKATGKDVSEINTHTIRPPVLGVKLNKIASGGDDVD